MLFICNIPTFTFKLLPLSVSLTILCTSLNTCAPNYISGVVLSTENLVDLDVEIVSLSLEIQAIAL